MTYPTTGAVLLVKRRTVDPNNFRSWHAGMIVDVVASGSDHWTEPGLGGFFHVIVSNKTVEEVQHYMSEWKHDSATYEVVRAKGVNRRVRVTSNVVSVTGKGAFIRADVEEMLENIDAQYHGHGQNWFEFNVSASSDSERGELAQMVRNTVEGWTYSVRRWWINPVGMVILKTNLTRENPDPDDGSWGWVEGTAAQLSNYLEDRLTL